jgi:hypothetical protein
MGCSDRTRWIDTEERAKQTVSSPIGRPLDTAENDCDPATLRQLAEGIQMPSFDLHGLIQIVSVQRLLNGESKRAPS